MLTATLFALAVSNPSGAWTNPHNMIGEPTAYSTSMPLTGGQGTPALLCTFDTPSLAIHPASSILSLTVTLYARADCQLDPQAGICLYSEGVSVQPPEYVGVLATIDPWEVTIGGPGYDWGMKLTPEAIEALVVGLNASSFGPGYMHFHAVSVTVEWEPPSAPEEPL